MEELTNKIKEVKRQIKKLYEEQEIILKYLNVNKLNEINIKIYKLRQELKQLKAQEQSQTATI